MKGASYCMIETKVASAICPPQNEQKIKILENCAGCSLLWIFQPWFKQFK
jgi:hypothetical protein